MFNVVKICSECGNIIKHPYINERGFEECPLEGCGDSQLIRANVYFAQAMSQLIKNDPVPENKFIEYCTGWSDREDVALHRPHIEFIAARFLVDAVYKVFITSDEDEPSLGPFRFRCQDIKTEYGTYYQVSIGDDSYLENKRSVAASPLFYNTSAHLEDLNTFVKILDWLSYYLREAIDEWKKLVVTNKVSHYE